MQPISHRNILHTWILVLTLSLTVQLLTVNSLKADEGAECEPAAAEESPREPGFFDVWGKRMDTAHDSIERNILEQTIKLDDFFGKENARPDKATRYQLRLRNSFRIDQHGTIKLGPSVRLNLALSKINDRLNLIISGESEPEPLTQSLPQDPGNPGYDRTTPDTHFVNTELRYDLLRIPSMLVFVGAGVQLKLPFEAFARSRVEFRHKFSDSTLFSGSETLFVKNTDLFGETTEITLEHLLDQATILRLSSTGTTSQEIHGLEWGSELSLVRELSPRSAGTLTGGAYGNINNSTVANTYRVLARYRRNFLRSWLFYELEPEIFWERNIRDHDAPTFAFTFRLDIVFKGSSLAQATR
jgi:hypothetical protein